MRLLLDIDGVICSYQFPTLVKNFFGVDITKYQLYAYDIADVLGVSHLAINTMFKEQVYGEPTFEENAREVLRELHQDHSIIIFTNRIKYMKLVELIDWLEKYEIPFDGVDMKGIGSYDLYVDDSPAKLMSVDSKVKLLYDQPWNKGCLNITGELKRVHNWQEVRHYV